jgi:hypothetical protein
LCSQRFPPPGSCQWLFLHHDFPRPSSCGLPSRPLVAPFGTSKIFADVAARLGQGFKHPGDPFTVGRCYPRSIGRSSLNVSCPSEVFSPRVSAVLTHRRLYWAFSSRRISPLRRSLYKVSKNTKVG